MSSSEPSFSALAFLVALEWCELHTERQAGNGDRANVVPDAPLGHDNTVVLLESIGVSHRGRVSAGNTVSSARFEGAVEHFDRLWPRVPVEQKIDPSGIARYRVTLTRMPGAIGR